MKTQAEIIAEITRLNQLKNLEMHGVTVRLITLIALEWAMGFNPVSPADRLEEVSEELAYDGAIDAEGGRDGEGNN
jgi:hypothetical protein